MEGSIFVDGVLASCYPSTDHDLAHLGTAPMRWIPGFIELILGDENGCSAYITIAYQLGEWLYPTYLLLQ